MLLKTICNVSLLAVFTPQESKYLNICNYEIQKFSSITMDHLSCNFNGTNISASPFFAVFLHYTRILKINIKINLSVLD